MYCTVKYSSVGTAAARLVYSTLQYSFTVIVYSTVLQVEQQQQQPDLQMTQGTQTGSGAAGQGKSQQMYGR